MSLASDKFLQELVEAEDISITRTMAFMSYNPSIGRVLEKGGVKKFMRIAVKLVQSLPDVKSRDKFDSMHNKYVNKVIDNIATSKSVRASYGQAQKPINVFLKVYVDWASRPNSSVRKNLLPWLHVPLDSVLMETVKWNYLEWYKGTITPHIPDKIQPFALSRMDKRLYYRWQHFFREKSPKKPLVFDIAWAVNR